MALENKFSEVAENTFYSVSYNQSLKENKLRGSRCKKCGSVSVPPRPICHKCNGNEMELVDMKGKGKLIAYTVIAVGTSFMVEEGYNRDHPYCSGVVELEEGARVVARIEGVDTSKPETIKIGIPLTVEYLHRGEGDNAKTYLAFKP